MYIAARLLVKSIDTKLDRLIANKQHISFEPKMSSFGANNTHEQCLSATRSFGLPQLTSIALQSANDKALAPHLSIYLSGCQLATCPPNITIFLASAPHKSNQSDDIPPLFSRSLSLSLFFSSPLVMIFALQRIQLAYLAFAH